MQKELLTGMLSQLHSKQKLVALQTRKADQKDRDTYLPHQSRGVY
jgi:hypothetical protein